MSTLSTSSTDAAEESKAPAVAEAASAPSPAPAAPKRVPRAKVVKATEATAPVLAIAEVQVPAPAKTQTKTAPRTRKSSTPADHVAPATAVPAAPKAQAKKPAPTLKKGDAAIKPVKTKTPKVPKGSDVVATEPAVVKHKLIRDSFTFPENEYAQIEALKRKALAKAYHVKKSEVLRAGIAALSAMSEAALLATLKAVPALKTGRPKSGKKR